MLRCYFPNVTLRHINIIIHHCFGLKLGISVCCVMKEFPLLAPSDETLSRQPGAGDESELAVSLLDKPVSSHLTALNSEQGTV